MKSNRVLISGAGVAGLTLAFWLKRYGFVPTLVEKSPSLRTDGYKIDLRGVALEIIKRMGIYEALVAKRTGIADAMCVDKVGGEVTQMSADLAGTRLEGVDLEIMRSDLCLILREALGEVEILFDDTITLLREDQKGVYVEFEKNSPRTFDCIVGADGLHSTVRKLVFGEESQFSKEFGVYVAVFSLPNFLELRDSEVEHHAPGKFVNVYRSSKDLNAKAALAFYVESPFKSREPKEQKKLIQSIFANGAWVMPQILRAMENSCDFYFDSMTQIHMPTWSKGAIALVGDAAYCATPMSGQGTSIAIAGAYILAGELFQAQGDTSIAFSSYEELMRPFIDENQALATMSARIMKPSLYSTCIHLLATLMPSRLLHYFKTKSLKEVSKAANALTLKSYT